MAGGPGAATGRRAMRDLAPRGRNGGEKSTFHVGEAGFQRAPRGRRALNARRRRGPPGRTRKSREKNPEKTQCFTQDANFCV